MNDNMQQFSEGKKDALQVVKDLRYSGYDEIAMYLENAIERMSSAITNKMLEHEIKKNGGLQ